MRFLTSGYTLLILVLCGLCSCNSTKYIAEGEYLLDKISIKTDNPDYGAIELRPYVKQLPNYKMFGLNKTQLQLYNLSGKDSSKWINRQLKKMGEVPVIFDSTLVFRTNKEFKKLFINKGFMDVEVSSTISRQGKKANVNYYIKTNNPYRIGDYTMNIADSAVNEELFGKNPSIYRLPNEPASVRNTLIRHNMLFDRNVLDKERERITGFLRNRGYYAFEKEYISYNADTTQNHLVDLELKLDLYPEILPNGMFAEVPHRRYFIDKTYIYLDYNPLKASDSNQYIADDSIRLDNYIIYYKGKRPSIRPGTLIEHSYLTPGRAYAQSREEITYSSYSTLQALNNTSILFEKDQRNDSSLLNAYILTMPAKKQAVTFSIEGTNTAGDLGIASSINYNHRNLFKGSESFNFKVRGAYEAISENILSDYYLNLGAEAAIRFPKFMFPFLSRSFKRSMRASTEFAFSTNFQTRPEYDRILLSGGLKYIWQSQGTKTSRHQFNLLDINYLTFPAVDSGFIMTLPANARLFIYNEQFIVGMGYTYSYSTFNPLQKQRNVKSFRASFESAGNMLYGLFDLFNAPKDENGSYTLFDTHFFQFVRGDFDYSKTTFIDKQNSITWRIGAGIGIPYGNSKELPFEKRYYSGGANSVRAWTVRSLGPGAYHTTPTTTLYEQSGDIKLDMNLEYRSRFFWKLEAAAFIDAGNIWTIRNYEKQEQGQFKLNSFYKQIALGYGLGIRFDFDIFLLRLDGGWKAYDPGQDGKDRWKILHPNFTNNFAWHFAVGYPF